MELRSLLENIFSVKDYGETHHIMHLFGFKIKIPKAEFAKKRKENLYYYYKENNIDITTLPPAEGQVRDIQLANLALLREMDYVCKQAGLKYWLDGGTLLGAVRHKGFIPWDDDIDTAMLREDYEQIIQAFKKYSRNSDIFADYSKSLTNTCQCIIKIQHKKCPHLFVDIFPWDNYGKRITNKEQIDETNRIKELRALLQSQSNFSETVECILDRISFSMKNNVLNVKEQDPYGDYVWGMDFNHPWKNWFSHYEVLHPIKTIKFEGFEFPCLNDPDAFLSRLYRDYMAYPKKIGMGHCMYLKLTDDEKEIIEKLKKSLK